MSEDKEVRTSHESPKMPASTPALIGGSPATGEAALHFIRQIVHDDLEAGRFGGRVQTRFPPEPNGYLHIGHAKSICLNFGLAAEFGGLCNLRFDDTNPVKEEVEYVEAIKRDVAWLGFQWNGPERYASDYLEQLYEWAVQLIRQGDAFVCELSAEEIREYRGTLVKPGRPSPWRNRTVEENLALFARMRDGEFPDGSHTLRAKIDMASPNLNMRDPVMYRILHAPHHRTGTTWCIYPMYDWAHGLCDSIEGITHSICTLEFEDHRPLYDWFIGRLGIYHPRQIEFARLNLNHTLMSKRRLLELVRSGVVDGWDDPRLPTISGLRRRGYTPASIRDFCERIGVAKRDNTIDLALLEYCLRQDLEAKAPRALAVLRPLKVIVENWPAGQVEEMEAPCHPTDASLGSRRVPFTRELFIESDDFQENPAPKYFRLAPGREVRLRYGYLITCREVVKEPATGAIRELRCTYDPATRGGNTPDGRKVKGTIHWVSAEKYCRAEVRLYDRLFSKADPGDVAEGGSFMDALNPASLVKVEAALEAGLSEAAPGRVWQFERQGYFVADSKDSRPGAPIFNRTATLKDGWGGK